MTETIMPATLARLTPAPRLSFDHDVLSRVCARRGPEAEAYIAGILGEIESYLLLAETQLAQRNLGGLGRTCEDLGHLGAAIGMRTLETCADAVRDCLATGDDVALAACMGRLGALARPDAFAGCGVGDDTVA
jgi:hypothetical protein